MRFLQEKLAAMHSQLFVSKHSRFLLFLVVGGISATITILIRAIANWIVIFEIAVAVAHVVGLIVAFTLNRFLVFRGYRGRLLPAYSRFFLVNAGSLLIATSTSSVLYRFILAAMLIDPYTSYVAHFLGLAACAIPSYLGHLHFSFREKDSAAAEGARPKFGGKSVS